MFVRDEHQEDVGSSPHIHMMAGLKFKELNEDQIRKLNYLVRASVCDI